MADLDGHVWQTRSRQLTSDGVVSYQRCHCGLWRLLLWRRLLEPGCVLADRIGAGNRDDGIEPAP